MGIRGKRCFTPAIASIPALPGESISTKITSGQASLICVSNFGLGLKIAAQGSLAEWQSFPTLLPDAVFPARTTIRNFFSSRAAGRPRGDLPRTEEMSPMAGLPEENEISSIIPYA